MEFVFVVPRRALFPASDPQGFAPFGLGRGVDPASGSGTTLENRMTLEEFERAVERHGFFVERARAEVEPDWKQVIPYNVVVAGDEVLLLRRTSKGGEARLHDKLSIGVGGHLEPQDCPKAGDAGGGRASILSRGAARELAEELEIEGPFEIEPIGLINDDSNPVGAVHVGLAQIVRVDGSVGIREKHVLEGRLVRLDELRRLRAEGANYESWSALLVDALLADMAAILAHSDRPRGPRGPRHEVHGGAGASIAPRR
jgi:predicted NUDIX family phosphoesterase